jgi:hypothetical protein
MLFLASGTQGATDAARLQTCSPARAAAALRFGNLRRKRGFHALESRNISRGRFVKVASVALHVLTFADSVAFGEVHGGPDVAAAGCGH